MLLYIGGSQRVGFQKGGFWQMFPCTEISSKKSFLAVLPWQKKAMIVDIPGPREPERGHIRQNRPSTKPPFVSSQTVINRY